MRAYVETAHNANLPCCGAVWGFRTRDLCDEPTGALDYKTGKQVLALLQATCRKQGRTVIVITHNSALAAMADRVIRINSGRVIDQTVNPNPTPVERIEW